MAKKCNLIAVKVLGDNGRGSISGIIQGIQWAVSHARSRGWIQKSVGLSAFPWYSEVCGADIGGKVANMSLGSGFSQALNNAVANAVHAGMTMVVAAGNDDRDACNYSPASEPLAFTIGSIDPTDTKSSFSNWGSRMIPPSTLPSFPFYFERPSDNENKQLSISSPPVVTSPAPGSSTATEA